MRTYLYKTVCTIFFALLLLLILFYPQTSFSYASAGLTLWFERMVPTLFPFMILSTLLIRQNLTDSFVNILYPLFGKLYHVSKSGVYCIFLGFLCGFPMGARTIAELYEKQNLTKREASLLLSFCNNIGPVYFISYALPLTGLLHTYPILFFLIGMYGIPLLYGLFVERTGFLLPKDTSSILPKTNNQKQSEKFSESLEHAIDSGIHGITVLGAYMILCNILNLIPFLLKNQLHMEEDRLWLMITHCLLEITGGISRMGNRAPFCTLILLTIGGLSCILQTQSMIKNSGLPIGPYIIHKLVQTTITAFYYFFLRFFLL